MKKRIFALLLFVFALPVLQAQQIALLKYSGGGDWYANPTALPNLISFCNQNIGTAINNKPETVTAASQDLYRFPFIHMTGHGNVIFNEEEIENLRTYLLSGGFLHIDDNYGMDEYIRKEFAKLFPDKKLQEIPASHPIFSTAFPFPKGLPKIHEHDAKPPQAFGIFENERLICLYTYESDLGDGWEDPEVHNDPEEVRRTALQMGANIIKYVFEN